MGTFATMTKQFLSYLENSCEIMFQTEKPTLKTGVFYSHKQSEKLIEPERDMVYFPRCGTWCCYKHSGLYFHIAPFFDEILSPLFVRFKNKRYEFAQKILMYQIIIYKAKDGEK